MSDRPILLDIFCGAGGAAMGYYRAGFDVVGVDIAPQKHYPFKFIQADALDYIAWHGKEYDAIHASPPCQAYSSMQRIHKNKDKHPDLIEPVRKILSGFSIPWVIENVEHAPLKSYFMLCGTMFGLTMRKHRYFESSIELPILTLSCNHTDLYDPFHGGEMARNEKVKHAVAIGVDFEMSLYEVRNAIPPAYTEFIGAHLLSALGR